MAQAPPPLEPRPRQEKAWGRWLQDVGNLYQRLVSWGALLRHPLLHPLALRPGL